jgi:tetratricopeptide (TPR) repeat protein
MIKLPAQLMPSELLCCEDLSPFIDKLLQGAYTLRHQEQWDKAERCALQAIEASQEAGDLLNRAVAHVHLGDMHRERGRLGPALTDYGRAQRIFRWQAPSRQRHNEAVVTYALGLVHHLLGSELDALKWYERSTELLGTAKAHWTTVDALKRVDVCSRLERWIDILSDHLMRGLTYREMDRPLDIWVPVVLAAKRGRCVERVAIQRQDSVLIGRIDRFNVHPLEEGWSIRMDAEDRYGAQQVPEEIRSALHASQEDHVLMEWGDPLRQEERRRMEELDQASSFDFLRDADGTIYAIPRDPTIIGGREADDGVRAGQIAALLEPTTLLEPGAPPPEEPEPAPGEELSDEPDHESDEDVIELYNKLLSLIGGSRRTARGLIDYERKRTPDASLYELIDRAISRLLRDRRSTS